MGFAGRWGLGMGSGKGSPKLGFEPGRPGNGDINGNKEMRGEADGTVCSGESGCVGERQKGLT